MNDIKPIVQVAPDAAAEAIAELARELPPILYRDDPRFRDLTGFGRRTMSNLDSRGKGPAGRVVNGRRVGYPRASLLAWLAARLKAAPARQARPEAFGQKGA